MFGFQTSCSSRVGDLKMFGFQTSCSSRVGDLKMFGFQTSCSSRVGDLKLCNFVLGNKLSYQFFDKSQRFKSLFPVLYVCYILVRINIPNKVCEILYAIISVSYTHLTLPTILLV